VDYRSTWKPLIAIFQALQHIGQPKPARQVVASATASQIEQDYIRARNSTARVGKSAGREAMFWIGMVTGIIPLMICAVVAVVGVAIVYGLIGTAVVAVTGLVRKRALT
jgi:hypothetical protein